MKHEEGFTIGTQDRFLAALSQELRTPLTPVLAAAELLASPFKLSDAEVKRNAELIRRNILLEVRLIDDLLDLTRLSRGKMQLKTEPVDLHAVLREAVDSCTEAASRRDVVFDVDLAAPNHVIEGEQARLLQVFCTLLSNAARFSNAGGSVQVLTSNRQENLDIVISDSGLGLSPDRLKEVFEPFQKRQRGLVPQTEGLGLSLAIAKGLVEAHEGSITAVSEGIGKGATFTVQLPNATSLKSASLDAPVQSQDQVAVPRNYTILLVDDHDDTRHALKSLLEKKDYRVLPAAGVQEAVELASTQPFDLLLSDLSMPDGSGLELMRTLKPKGIKGIAISGHGTDEDLEKSRQAGFSEHITKPISWEMLEEAIKSLQLSTLA